MQSTADFCGPERAHPLLKGIVDPVLLGFVSQLSSSATYTTFKKIGQKALTPVHQEISSFEEGYLFLFF